MSGGELGGLLCAVLCALVVGAEDSFLQTTNIAELTAVVKRRDLLMLGPTIHGFLDGKGDKEGMIPALGSEAEPTDRPTILVSSVNATTTAFSAGNGAEKAVDGDETTAATLFGSEARWSATFEAPLRLHTLWVLMAPQLRETSFIVLDTVSGLDKRGSRTVVVPIPVTSGKDGGPYDGYGPTLHEIPLHAALDASRTKEEVVVHGVHPLVRSVTVDVRRDAALYDVGVTLWHEADASDGPGATTAPHAVKLSDDGDYPEPPRPTKAPCNERIVPHIQTNLSKPVLVESSWTGNGKVPIAIPSWCNVAFVTSIYGTYEKTAKPPARQNHAADVRPCFILFTNREDLRTSDPDPGHSWMSFHFPYHRADPRYERLYGPDDESAHNFHRAKFYKQQMHRLLPSHVEYAVWTDSTVQITSPQTAIDWVRLLQNHASMFTTQHHSLGSFHEMAISVFKYGSFHVWKYMINWYAQYLRDGFCEFYWREPERRVRPSANFLARIFIKAHCDPPSDTVDTELYAWGLYHARAALRDGRAGSRRLGVGAGCSRTMLYGDYAFDDEPYPPSSFSAAARRPPFRQAPYTMALGMYTTRIVGMDFRIPEMRDFLDYWYESTFDHWQDQVSYPPALWRFGIRPIVLEQLKPQSEWYRLYGHGQ